MINRGGENIYPREIEIPLEKHPEIAEVAVVARRMRRWESARRGTLDPINRNYPLPRSAVMAKAQDSRKEEKKKPAQTPKEKKKAKQEKKKDKA
jgi:long-subunit acyl-CoA synthetase (AMP-forming)